MAKEYKVGEKYYLPVTVEKVTDGNYGVTIGFDDGAGEDTTLICNDPDLLLTATEIAENVVGRRCEECLPVHDEVVAERDRLAKENSELMAAADKLKDTIVDRTKDVQHYKEENDRLKKALEKRAENVMNLLEENERLKGDCNEWKDTASKRLTDVQTLTAENDKLKSKVGKYTADIQDMAAEIHFLKEKSGKPTEETTKTLHVVLNDGTEIEFRRYTGYQYRTDVDMFVVKDGDKHIAGFLRGDKPTNFAYWWTE